MRNFLPFSSSRWIVDWDSSTAPSKSAWGWRGTTRESVTRQFTATFVGIALKAVRCIWICVSMGSDDIVAVREIAEAKYPIACVLRIGQL